MTTFKNHFPLCEGKVINLTEENLDTSICKNDGLKKGMKLIVYDDQNTEDDIIIGEAKVKAVLERYSQAEISETWEVSNIKDISTNWWVMTR